MSSSKKPQVVFVNTQNNSEYLRLILIKQKSPYSLKFSLMGNQFEVKFLSLEDSDGIPIITSEEITYHSSNQSHPMSSIIHIKNNDPISPYTTVSKKITDLINSEFPIPICRIQLSDDSYRTYFPKKKHHTYDFSYGGRTVTNCVDVFIAKKGFCSKNFGYCWPNMHLLWLMTDIQYLLHGHMFSERFIEAMKNGPKLMAKGIISFNNIELIFKPSMIHNISCNSIYFYENYDYFTLLGATLIQLIDEKTNKPISPIMRAYELDQDRQENILGITKNHDLFMFLKERILKITRLNVNRQIYQIPIIGNEPALI